MSDSNLSKISYRKNTGAFPGLPDGTGQMTRLRFTKATLEKKNKTVQSDEITGDSQVQDLVKVGVQAGGSIDAEMIAQEFNTFFESLLRGTPNSYLTGEGVINLGNAIAGQVLTFDLSGSGLSTVPAARYMKISGAVNDGNNGIKKVASIDNDAHTITFVAGSFTADESGAGITVEWNFVRNGVNVQDDYLIEEQFSNPRSFAGFYGQSVDSISLNLKAQAKAELSINFMGYDGLEGNRSYGGVRQISQLVFNAQPDDGVTLTLTPGSAHYKFNTVLTHFDGSVLIGATCHATLLNLIAAINLAAGGGTTYSSETTADNWTAAIGASVTALGSVLNDGTQPSDGDSVTIGGKAYTFKTALTPTEGEVKIASTAAFTVARLVAAIMHGSGNGTNYSCAAVNPNVTAGIDGSNPLKMNVTAKASGAAGNLVSTIATIGGHFTWNLPALSGGTDSIVITAVQSGSDGAVSTFSSSGSGYSTFNVVQAAVDPTAASSNPIMNTTANIGTVYENGAAITCPLSSLALDIKGGLRERPAVSNEGTQQFGTGDIVPTGKMDAYFQTRDLLNAFFAHADRSFEFALIDGEGRLINFYFPRIKYTKGAPPISGKNTDIMLPIEWQAIRDATTGFTVQIDMVDF